MIIYWSEDDEAFVVGVPELPGCITERTPEIRQIDQLTEPITHDHELEVLTQLHQNTGVKQRDLAPLHHRMDVLSHA